MKNSAEYRHLYGFPSHENARQPKYNRQRPRDDYPSKDLQAEIRSLLLRCGISPTRSRMDEIKKLTRRQAEAKRGMLLRAAVAAEQARAEHPDGNRSTSRQLEDWARWHKSAHGVEPDADALARFLNLDTASANNETMALRWIVWERQDRDGTTPEWRVRRGLYNADAVAQGQAERASQRRLSLDEMQS